MKTCVSATRAKLSFAPKTVCGDGVLPRIVGYVRVSSDGQVEDGYSLDMQEEMIRNYCNRRFGSGEYLLEIFRDEGISGSLGASHRPGLTSVIERLRTRSVDCFVVYRVDRIYRNHLEQLKFRAEFFAEGSRCQLVSITENLDLGTKTGRLSANVLSIIAEYQREQLRDIVADGLRRRRGDGYPTGDIGYGWRRTPRQNGSRPGLERDPERAPWVRLAFELALRGWGSRLIARELEQRGATPPSRSGRWTAYGIKTLLRSPIHAGFIRDGQNITRGVHFEERIVEPEEYEQVVIQMAARRREVVRGMEKEVQPLYRVAHCGTCGGLITVIEDDTGLAYRCRGSADRGDVLPTPSDAADPLAVCEPGANHGVDAKPAPATGDWCPGWHKSAALINKALLDLLKQAVRHPEFQQLAEEEARRQVFKAGRKTLEREKADISRSLQRHREKRQRLTRGYVDGVVAGEDYQKLFGELARTLEELEARLTDIEYRLAHQENEEALLERVRERLPDVEQVWEALRPEERRQLVRDLTEDVQITRQEFSKVKLRVKIPFLCAMEAGIWHAKSREMGFAAGVEGLSRRELALLALVADGETFPQIRERWKINTGHLQNLRRSIYRRLNVRNLNEAAELARERIAEERAILPIDVPTTTSRGGWRPTEGDRIRQVLMAYRRGMSRSEIGAELGLAVHTVRVLEYRARKLAGVATLAEVVALCDEEGNLPAQVPGGSGEKT